MSRRNNDLSGAVIFAVFGLIFYLIVMGIQWVSKTLSEAPVKNEREPIEIALSQVCNGKGVAEAATYDSQKKDIHPIVVLSTNGEPHEWSIQLPDDWFPNNVNEAQLVACVGDQIDIKVQTCNYGNFGIKSSTITRYQIERSFQIREAKTGKILIEKTYTGTMPPTCPKETQNGGRLDGSQLDYEWFSKYVFSYLVQGTTSP